MKPGDHIKGGITGNVYLVLEAGNKKTIFSNYPGCEIGVIRPIGNGHYRRFRTKEEVERIFSPGKKVRDKITGEVYLIETVDYSNGTFSYWVFDNYDSASYELPMYSKRYYWDPVTIGNPIPKEIEEKEVEKEEEPQFEFGDILRCKDNNYDFLVVFLEKGAYRTIKAAVYFDGSDRSVKAKRGTVVSYLEDAYVKTGKRMIIQDV